MNIFFVLSRNEKYDHDHTLVLHIIDSDILSIHVDIPPHTKEKIYRVILKYYGKRKHAHMFYSIS